MAPPDWIRLGYIAGALIALAAAFLERARGERKRMLLAVVTAVILLFAGRAYGGSTRAVDYLTSVASTVLGTALLAGASLRKRRDRQ